MFDVVGDVQHKDQEEEWPKYRSLGNPGDAPNWVGSRSLYNHHLLPTFEEDGNPSIELPSDAKAFQFEENYVMVTFVKSLTVIEVYGVNILMVL